MKFAIISAGEGSRLALEGSLLPKPLVPICGEPMIGRLMRIMKECGAETVSVIVNPSNTQTLDYLHSVRDLFGVDIHTAATESSMHSLNVLAGSLHGDRCCVTTVDTIFNPADFRAYIHELETSDSDGLMGVTSYIDDEKPLYVGISDGMRITGFHDEPSGCTLVSGGIYGLSDKSLDVLSVCVSSGLSRMRAYQRRLVEEHLDIRAFRFGDIIDVDHISDIGKAEKLIHSRTE